MPCVIEDISHVDVDREDLERLLEEAKSVLTEANAELLEKLVRAYA